MNNKCFTSWIRSSKDISKFIRKKLSIETSNQLTSWLLKKTNAKLLILDSLSKPLSFLNPVSITLDRLCIWLQNLWKEINIPTRLIYGRLELFFTKCSLVKLHGEPKPKKNFSRKLKLKEFKAWSKKESSTFHLWQSIFWQNVFVLKNTKD